MYTPAFGVASRSVTLLASENQNSCADSRRSQGRVARWF